MFLRLSDSCDALRWSVRIQELWGNGEKHETHKEIMADQGDRRHGGFSIVGFVAVGGARSW